MTDVYDFKMGDGIRNFSNTGLYYFSAPTHSVMVAR
jgi:hypothetical protein